MEGLGVLDSILSPSGGREDGIYAKHPRTVIESAPCRRISNTCVTRTFERHHGDKCGWRTKYWQEIHKKARWGHELEGWQITHIPVDPEVLFFSEPDTSQFALLAFISLYSFLEMPFCPSLDEQGLLHLTFINLLFLRFIFVIIHMHMPMWISAMCVPLLGRTRRGYWMPLN